MLLTKTSAAGVFRHSAQFSSLFQMMSLAMIILFGVFLSEATLAQAGTGDPPTQTENNVPSSLLQGNNLYYFNGLTPSRCAVQTQIVDDTNPSETGQPQKPATFKWDITAGGNRVTFLDGSTSITEMGAPFITIKSIAISKDPNDVTIQETYNGSVVATLSLSVYIAASMKYVKTVDKAADIVGYYSYVYYQILDQWGGIIQDPLEINENFTGPVVSDYAGQNWPRNTPNGALVDCSGKNPIDQISGPGNADQPNPIPTPVSPTDASAGIAVHHWPGTWSIASVTPGQGIPLLSINWQRYRGYGRHK